MADTFTPSLNLCKPEINQSAQTWGIKLNSDLDLLDTFAASMKTFQNGNDARINQLIANAIAAAIPRGVVVSWIGGAGNIPAGWLLCNGANGTPNLADRFILGNVGSRTNWETGGDFGHNAVTDTQGWHGHGGGVGAHVLSWNEMPVHNHGAWTDTQGDHQHTAQLGWSYMNNPGGANLPAGTVPGTNNVMTTNVAGAHGHNVGIGNAGGNWGHDHPLTINGDGSHAHNVNVSVVPPYFSLAYIMRA